MTHDALRQLMATRRWTRAQVARLADVTMSTVHYWLANHHPIPEAAARLLLVVSLCPAALACAYQQQWLLPRQRSRARGQEAAACHRN